MSRSMHIKPSVSSAQLLTFSTTLLQLAIELARHFWHQFRPRQVGLFQANLSWPFRVKRLDLVTLQELLSSQLSLPLPSLRPLSLQALEQQSSPSFSRPS